MRELKRENELKREVSIVIEIKTLGKSRMEVWKAGRQHIKNNRFKIRENGGNRACKTSRRFNKDTSKSDTKISMG